MASGFRIIRDPVNADRDRVLLGDKEIPLADYRVFTAEHDAEVRAFAQRSAAASAVRRLGVDPRLTESALDRMERG